MDVLEEAEEGGMGLAAAALVTRALLLFLLDGLSNSLPLCALGSRVGYEALFRGVPLRAEANSSVPNDAPRYVLPGYVGLEQALFGWSGPCNELWDYLPYSSYFVLTLGYVGAGCALCSALLSTTQRLLNGALWLFAWLLVVANAAWTMAHMGRSEEWSTLGEGEDSAVVARLLAAVSVRVAWVVFGGGVFVKLRQRSHPSLFSSPLTGALLRVSFAAPLTLRLSPLLFDAEQLGTSAAYASLPLTLLLPLGLFESSAFFLGVLPSMILENYASLRRLRRQGRDWGVHEVVLHHWRRLQVGLLLRLYWACRVAALLVFLLVEAYFHRGNSRWGRLRALRRQTGSVINGSLLTPGDVKAAVAAASVETHPLIDGLQYLLARGCETLVSLAGMTSVVAAVASGLGDVVHALLHGLGDDQEGREENAAGSHLGLLFVILALQTGLTELRPEKRLLKLYRNLSLLSMALLHFAHAKTDAVLSRLTSLGWSPWPCRRG